MNMAANKVKELREAQLMSKAELARKAGLSPLTVDRIESGMGCRLDTKRKIILALGMTVADKDRVFTPETPGASSNNQSASGKE
jgi:DNA-binding XRE family transcriptional regulator